MNSGSDREHDHEQDDGQLWFDDARPSTSDGGPTDGAFLHGLESILIMKMVQFSASVSGCTL